ncbi:hypothetical protein SAMN02799624_05336 [Paenibacillus sp. UNC496MF]|uniref:hypothetical protein n=1 Tax=Paenibacillus sp. UNC496MF TaxID=1502753 RepID=UPI0008EC3F46|nr:hypothetical protein [Paenibacillus sp. UNC496MF]SFJ64358.1 hypothetical protein SAMN02799624_05336 [Paenibacillus sp. UNC496MF]
MGRDMEPWLKLRDDYEKLQAENAALKQENERLQAWSMCKVSPQEAFEIQRRQSLEIEQLIADKAALLECVKWYADEFNYGPLHAGYGPNIKNDQGWNARECLNRIGADQKTQ